MRRAGVAEWRQVIREESRQYWELSENGAIITLRPHAGDAGRWEAKAFGVPGESVAFPRYYMDLINAHRELREFLNWRLRVAHNRGLSHACPDCGGRDH